jgi:glucose-6-phosphate-specific signal transduction histidine kinase
MKLAKAMVQVLLAGLFIGCLLQVPYGYYQFLRLASLPLFGVLAFNEYKRKYYSLTILCVCAALLFNPIIPVYLDRNTWQNIDKLMASLMFLWLMVDAVLLFIKKVHKTPFGLQQQEEVIQTELQPEA